LLDYFSPQHYAIVCNQVAYPLESIQVRILSIAYGKKIHWKSGPLKVHLKVQDVKDGKTNEEAKERE